MQPTSKGITRWFILPFAQLAVGINYALNVSFCEGSYPRLCLVSAPWRSRNPDSFLYGVLHILSDAAHYGDVLPGLG